jgi:hypothetical protein
VGISEEATVVPARDRWRIEATEGFVDRGGEGRHDSFGVLFGVAELGQDGVPATVGDCKGECKGKLLADRPIIIGGSNGVVACPGSSSAWAFASSISIDVAPDSIKFSSGPVCTGEGDRRLSCLEMALNAGLTSCEETEFDRERIASEWVMIDSLGLAPVLVFHFLENEGNRVPIRLEASETGESSDLRFLNEEFAENWTSVGSFSPKL